ncbi:V-type ATPase subunit [Methanopyrus kandleri]
MLGLAGLQDYTLLAVGIIALVTVLSIILSIPITDVVWRYAPYAYPLPRAKAVEAETLSDEDYEELKDAPVRDLVTRLEELGVEPEAARVVLDGNTAPLEIELKRRAVESVMKRIVETSPEDVSELARALMAKYELEDIKAVLRARHAGEEPKHLVDTPVLLEAETWRELKEARSVPEVVDYLRGTPYDRGLEEALREYEETGSLLPLELALDRAYYEHLWDLVVSEKVDEELARLVGLEIDLYNVEVALRGAILNLDPERVLEAMAEGGWELAEWRKRELAEAEDPLEVVERLSGTSLGPYLEEAAEEYSEGRGVQVFDEALRKARYELAREIAGSDLIGAPAVVHAVYEKQREVDNVISLINAKVADVETMLV